MRNIDRMVEIASWSEIKKALHSAAHTYSVNPRNLHGFWHGEPGRFRAQNLERLTSSENDIKPDEIFTLLTAVFKSSSSGLAHLVSEALFTGIYVNHFIINGESRTDDTLASAVFSPAFLAELKCSEYAFKRNSDGETWSDKTFDKFSAAKGLMDYLVEKYANKKDFDTQIERTIHMLEKKPGVQEVQMHTLEAVSASQ